MIKLIKNTFYKEKTTKLKLMWFIARAKQLSFGPKCEEFEKEFSLWQMRQHSIFVNSGSSANLALIQALINLGRLKKGDKVGFSALGWATTVMPIIELGLEPVAIDIDYDSLNVPDYNIPKGIKALFLTNILGFSSNIEAIVKVCKKNKIILLEDNCEGLGSTYNGEKFGNFGLASTFSFYVGHHMSTIEGGMVCTNDSKLAEQLRIVRAHGWDRNLDAASQKRIRDDYHLSSFNSRYTFYSNGYNLRPTEIQGFLGLVQLKYIDDVIAKREQNWEYITGGHSVDRVSNFAIPIICRNNEERNFAVAALANLVETRPIVGGDLTQQPFYPYKNQRCPIARIVNERGFYVANNPDLNKKELLLLKYVYNKYHLKD